MNNKAKHNICPLCQGSLKEGTTTITVDFGSGVVVIRQAPASVCDQCGADWVKDNVAEIVEKIVNEAKANQSMIEVRSLSA